APFEPTSLTPHVEKHLADHVLRRGLIPNETYYEPKHPHVVARIQHLHCKPIAVRDSSDQHLVRCRLHFGLVTCSCGLDLTESKLVEPAGLNIFLPFQINGRQRFTILDALRPRGEFVPEAWFSEDESGGLRVRVYRPPQPGDEHVDIAVGGVVSVPENRAA